MRATLPLLSFLLTTVYCLLLQPDDAEGDEEGAFEAEVAARGVVPFFERVGAAGGAARADGDGGQAARDGDVRVGRGAVEVGPCAERARGLGGEPDERLLGRGRAPGPVADEPDVNLQRGRALPARGVLVLGRLARGAPEEGVEPAQLGRGLGAQVNVHARLARDDVDARAALDA